MKHPIFKRKPLTYETGWLVTTCGDKDASENIRMSYENLLKKGQTFGIEFVETPEDLIHHVPQLKYAKDISKWKGLWNRQAGWANAHNALKRMAEEVITLQSSKYSELTREVG